MFYNRSAKPTTRARQVSEPKIFLAPSRGLIRNEMMGKAKAGGAEVMDNWFPTPEGCRMRKGSTLHATIGDAVTHLTAYTSGGTSKFFATDADAIYDITTPASSTVAPTPDVSGQTGGDWSSIMFTTSGGSFLVMVNGDDDMQQYDGSSWLTVNAGSSPRAITGVDTDTFSHVWKYSSRLWFIGAGMSAWYLGTSSVGGAATEFPLGAVFSLGGSLLFGCSWSSDTGDGLDDYCAFVTTEGEVAMYMGDPASAMTKVGVYRIGRPIHKNAHFRAGGDVAVITDDGIVSIGAAIQKDRAALLATAITYPIEEAWREIIDERNSGVLPFSCVIWPSKTMLVIGIPSSGSQDRICLAANTRTGAWGRFTGWDTRCVTVFLDRLYFGTRDGTIVRGEVSGADQGDPYTATVLPKFDNFGAANVKAALHARVLARANNAFTPQLFACADYEIDTPTAIDADTDEASNLWDVGIWGQSVWGAPNVKRKQSRWQAVAAVGQAIAPGLQITSGRTTAPDIELIAIHLVVEEGDEVIA